MNREMDLYEIFFEELVPMATSMEDFTGRLVWKYWVECLEECCTAINAFLNLTIEYPVELIEDSCAEAFQRGMFSIDQVLCILRQEVAVRENGVISDLFGQLQLDF